MFDQGPVAARLLCRCSGAEASAQIAFAAMGKKHPSVYGLYHPKKVGNFGNSLFLLQQQWMWKIPDNGRWKGDSQVISSTTASIKGLPPIYGASSHQLESEASLDLPATRCKPWRLKKHHQVPSPHQKIREFFTIIENGWKRKFESLTWPTFVLNFLCVTQKWPRGHPTSLIRNLRMRTFCRHLGSQRVDQHSVGGSHHFQTAMGHPYSDFEVTVVYAC